MAPNRDATEQRRDSDEVVSIAALVRRWWAVFLLAAAVGGSAGPNLVLGDEAVYSIDLEVLVGPVVADAGVLEGAADLARTYGEIVESRTVVENAIAATGVGVAPEDVVVTAVAGHRSTTITITVQAPSGAAAVEIGSALVDSLDTTVRSSRRDPVAVPTEADPLGVDPDAETRELLLSGTTVVLIDDGGGLAGRRSLSPVQAGAVSALAALFLAAALALAVETRRRISPRSEILIRFLDGDLGRVDSAPLVPNLVRRRSRRTVAVDARARHDARLAADALLRRRPLDGPEILFVAAPTSGSMYAMACLQLAAALDTPAIVVDPTRILVNAIDPGQPPDDGRVRRILLDGAPTLDLWVPPRDLRVGPIPSILTGEDSDNRVGIVLVFAPVSHVHPEWRMWASAADSAVVLVSRKHRREAVLEDLVSRLHAVDLVSRGGISVRRRWIDGASGVLTLERSEQPDPPDGAVHREPMRI